MQALEETNQLLDAAKIQEAAHVQLQQHVQELTKAGDLEEQNAVREEQLRELLLGQLPTIQEENAKLKRQLQESKAKAEACAFDATVAERKNTELTEQLDIVETERNTLQTAADVHSSLETALLRVLSAEKELALEEARERLNKVEHDNGLNI